MRQPLKLLRSLHYSIWIGLLTLWLVIIALPAVATSHLDRQTPIAEKVNPDTLASSPNLAEAGSASLDSSRNLNTYGLLQKGKTAYETGRFGEAVQHWQRAAHDYQKHKNTAYQALAGNYLALAYRELGKWREAEEQVNQSIQLIEEYTPRRRETANLTAITAQILNTKGSLQLAMGQAELALYSWQQAEDYYNQDQDKVGLFGSRLNQAQALQH